MASALCRPSFLRTQTMAPFVWRDTTTPVLATAPDSDYDWYRMVPTKIPYQPLPTPPINVGGAIGGAQPAGALTPRNLGGLNTTLVRSVQQEQEREQQAQLDAAAGVGTEEDEAAYYRALDNWNALLSGRRQEPVAVLPAEGLAVLNQMRGQRSLPPLAVIPSGPPMTRASDIASRLAYGEALDTYNGIQRATFRQPVAALPSNALSILNASRLSRGLRPVAAVPATDPRNAPLLEDRRESPVVEELVELRESSSGPPEVIEFVDEASARRARCDQLIEAIPVADRSNADVMSQFRVVHGECADRIPMSLCVVSEIPTAFRTQAEKDAFIIANPSCARWALAIPVNAAAGCTLRMPLSFQTQAEKDAFAAANPLCSREISAVPVGNAGPPCTATAPERFETEADRATWLAANPNCASKAAAVPVGRDWTPYYVAGGVVAGVTVLGTIAYFALRETPVAARALPAPMPPAPSSMAAAAERWRRQGRGR